MGPESSYGAGAVGFGSGKPSGYSLIMVSGGGPLYPNGTRSMGGITGCGAGPPLTGPVSIGFGISLSGTIKSSIIGPITGSGY